MTAYRFVNRDGWERWVDVPDPPPSSWKLAEPYQVSDRAIADPPERLGFMHSRLFVRQPWRVRPWPDETVYVEDDMPLSDADRFGPDHPSLHREREYEAALRSIRAIVEREDPALSLGQAISAMGKVEDIESELRRLPAWLTGRPADE